MIKCVWTQQDLKAAGVRGVKGNGETSSHFRRLQEVLQLGTGHLALPSTLLPSLLSLLAAVPSQSRTPNSQGTTILWSQWLQNTVVSRFWDRIYDLLETSCNTDSSIIDFGGNPWKSCVTYSLVHVWTTGHLLYQIIFENFKALWCSHAVRICGTIAYQHLNAAFVHLCNPHKQDLSLFSSCVPCLCDLDELDSCMLEIIILAYSWALHLHRIVSSVWIWVTSGYAQGQSMAPYHKWRRRHWYRSTDQPLSVWTWMPACSQSLCL